MNLTLAIDDELLAQTRKVAAGRGTSVNQMVRELLEAATGLHEGAALADELDVLWERSSGRSGGTPFRRDDTYRDRVVE